MISRTYFLPMFHGRILGPSGRRAAIAQIRCEAIMFDLSGLQAEADLWASFVQAAELEDATLTKAGR